MAETKAEAIRQRDDARALAVRLEQEVAAQRTGCHLIGFTHYGGALHPDPRMFRPDPEASTDEERAAWRVACELWDRGEQIPFAINTFGLGSSVECVPDDKTIGRLGAAEAGMEILAEREWAAIRFRGDEPAIPICSVCYMNREEGHATDCWLGQALNRWRAAL